MLTTTQKKTAEAIVNIFETSQVRGNYNLVTLLTGDTGHLTYGRSQTTLGSGNLYKLLQIYCANPGALFGSRLESSLPRFSSCDLSLDDDIKVHNLLRASADDPVMRDTQDAFFDDIYWKPAERVADRLGICSPLGVAVVYDSFVHGSWKAMSERINKQVGTCVQVGEPTWISEYVAIRKQWLATHSRGDLCATAYRMEAFQRLIDQEYWGLNLPLVVRDKEISSATLTATPVGCYDGPQPGTRPLFLQSPMLRGLDVRLVQLGLSNAGIKIKADGVFGQTSVRLLKNYQLAKNLPETGVADAPLIAHLIS